MGNNSQVKKMRKTFNKAKRILHTSNSKTTIIAVNGCCYGRKHISDKGDYYKYCEQKFWEFISGDKNLYIQIIKPLGYQAKEKNDEFMKKYAAIINEFTYSFMQSFCIHGDID